jgi:GDPmannose 4,6-dehydratase
MILQQDKPEDFMIATRVKYMVLQFIEWSAVEMGIILQSEGEEVKEVATVIHVKGDKAPALKLGEIVDKVDPSNFRSTEVETLLGGLSIAKQKLG